MFCTKCGTEIKDGFNFCPKCGAPVFVKKEEVSENVGNTNSINEEMPKEEKEDESPSGGKKVSTKRTIKETKPIISYVPNPFMAKELDIEGVKMRAEQGDRKAMPLQCFRYEMGIGTEIDMEKYNELKELGAAVFDKEWISLFYYSKELATPYIVTPKG